jgi:hypothetical protein
MTSLFPCRYVVNSPTPIESIAANSSCKFAMVIATRSAFRLTYFSNVNDSQGSTLVMLDGQSPRTIDFYVGHCEVEDVYVCERFCLRARCILSSSAGPVYAPTALQHFQVDPWSVIVIHRYYYCCGREQSQAGRPYRPVHQTLCSPWPFVEVCKK